MPKVFIPYYAFEWVKPLPDWGMYLVFACLLLACFGIILGLLYRLSAILFFILFTYIELIDKTNYLNHYYFISLIAFILIFLPAGKAFSIDNRIRKRSDLSKVSNFYVLLPQLQMFTLYFFAGVAKLNHDWLFEAQPLKL
ncbi:MAG: HTTM domain-containing protein, partial [Flavobacteriales bacterium]|nr:HTTM domain-containing protein [Flavobacteriales bacterium]